MMSSFSTALSALDATTVGIDVVGNNLANLNTAGFKTSVVSFHDLVSQSLGTGTGQTQVGFGVGVPVTLRQFTQGATQTTGGPLDAAIQGNGFFVLKDSTGATSYTRGGNLQRDKSGNLVTTTGEKIQGWTQTNAAGGIDTNLAVGDIVLPVGALKNPQATTSMSFDLNLDSSAVAGDTFSRKLEVFDSLGSSHFVDLTFTKNASTTAAQWSYSASIPDADLTSPGTPLTGDLTFDPTGKLTVPDATTPQTLTLTGPLANGADTMTVDFGLWNGTTGRITQYAQASTDTAHTQNGYAAANLIQVGLADGGKIIAKYSNGDQTVVGQVAMALIANPDSLLGIGNNSYALSGRTAAPTVGLPGTGGRGDVMGGAVEGSTVDIAKEFTNLIVLQRTYQANSKVITTSDQITQETLALKQ
jgi:flagellar hook protein FlgE